MDLPFQIGDRVTITIPKENRAWGYNPCPDGTMAVVTGYDSYLNDDGTPRVNLVWVRVMTWDGKVWLEFYTRLTKVA